MASKKDIGELPLPPFLRDALDNIDSHSYRYKPLNMGVDKSMGSLEAKTIKEELDMWVDAKFKDSSDIDSVNNDMSIKRDISKNLYFPEMSMMMFDNSYELFKEKMDGMYNDNDEKLKADWAVVKQYIMHLHQDEPDDEPNYERIKYSKGVLGRRSTNNDFHYEYLNRDIQGVKSNKKKREDISPDHTILDDFLNTLK